MTCTLSFTLSNGLDSFLRVVSLLRRRGFFMEEVSFSRGVLTFSTSESQLHAVQANLANLADVQALA